MKGIEQAAKRKFLTINRCPRHAAYWSVAVEDADGGTRVTGSKCCGQWRTVKKFPLTKRDWEELAKLASEAAALED